MHAPAGNKWKPASFPMKPAAPGTRDSPLCEDTAESHFRDNPRLNNNVFGFYRRFIKDYAKIPRLLYGLLKGSQNKNGRSSFQWSEAGQKVFDFLISQLTSAPVPGFADFSKTFKLHTNAGLEGLGADLYQEQEGIDRVIGYASRGLSASDKNYPFHKLEFLALNWAISDKFREYLYGGLFSVFTDNNPLTYVLATARLHATGHRWLAGLAAFNFDIQFNILQVKSMWMQIPYQGDPELLILL